MGGKHSKRFCPRHYNSSSYGPSPTWDSSSYGPSSEIPSESHAQLAAKQKIQRRYSRIAKNYNSLDEVCLLSLVFAYHVCC